MQGQTPPRQTPPLETDTWLYQRIVQESPDAIICADREGTICLWNAGAALIFGYAANEAVGQSLDPWT
jgi:PAS domain S-box-containing protein